MQAPPAPEPSALKVSDVAAAASAEPPGSPSPSWVKRWVMASRPATLSAAVVPVLVGSAVAWAQGTFAALPALAAGVGACLIQIATNFVNDVADFEKGADTHERLGPTRVVQAGLLSAEQVKQGILVTLFLTLMVGTYLVSLGGWPIVVIGIASVLSGIAYTAGPYPLGYHGLGDVFVMLFFGFVAVCGTVWVQGQSLSALAWWASMPVGALATAILVVNNVRDRETDVGAGKRTLPVRFGRRFGEVEYLLLLLLAYAVPLVLVLEGLRGLPVLLPLLTLPLAYARLRDLRQLNGVALNPVLANTAKLLLLHGLLFALGIVLG